MHKHTEVKCTGMGRRELLKKVTIGTAGLAAVSLAPAGCSGAVKTAPLKAGFARVKITPPLGTAMTGFGARDFDPAGCKGIHDDLYTNALYVSQGDRQVFIFGFDLLFFSRDEADRLKGAIGRKIDISPRGILLNTSHTHTGPKIGTWFYTPADPAYLQFVEDAVVRAACEAHDSAREVTMWAGATQSAVPMSRRRKLPDGSIEFAPYPEGIVDKNLPVCLFKDSAGKPVCLMFSVSCHPSTIKGVERSYWISADYPGAAMAELDRHLGSAVSLFLQGAGGDAKASVIGKGEDQWRAGTWDDVAAVGKMAADEVVSVLDKGLTQVEPGLCTSLIDMEWPLGKPYTREQLQEIIGKPQAHSESMPEVMQMWAKEKLSLLDRGYTLPTSVSIAAHGIHLGAGVRFVGIEGELVGGLGNLIQDFYGSGVTFAMGYTDGAQLYLPTSAQLDEGGYEAESWWEYRQPAPLAKGHEKILTATLEELKKNGIT
ncbi:hypothetical protein LLG96_08470 [bacterium]|nr:hypothetical protein [bacterium]